MSEYIAKVHWLRGKNETYIDNKYSRGHEWTFAGGITIQASSSVNIVPAPYSIEANIDPEEAFVASLSSCHMLFFLSIAAKNQYRVDSYTDNALGLIEKDPEGNLAMTLVTLNPHAQFSGDKKPTMVQLETMHHQAHQQCFIANSVKSKVVTKIII